jgi:hypothetical protein
VSFLFGLYQHHKTIWVYPVHKETVMDVLRAKGFWKQLRKRKVVPVAPLGPQQGRKVVPGKAKNRTKNRRHPPLQLFLQVAGAFRSERANLTSLQGISIERPV